MKAAPFLLLLFWLLVAASASAQYITSKADQAFNPIVYPGNSNVAILRIEVEIGTVPVTLTDMEFNTNGTSNPPNDISVAKLWYYNDSSSFNINLATLIGTFNNPWANNFMFLTAPNASYTGMSSFNSLASGINYFWLTYNTSAAGTPGNYLDACYINCKANAVNYVPTVSCPAGFSAINSFPTGISEGLHHPVISIYPVPASGEITIEFNRQIQEPVCIDLLDITGKKMDCLFDGIPKGNASGFRVSLMNHEPGNYLIRTVFDVKEYITRIVIL